MPPNMTSIASTTIMEEPAISPLDSAPTSRRQSEDPEAQKSNIRVRPPGMRRTSSAMSSKSFQKPRRDTTASYPSNCTSPTLEREPTLRVETEALHGYPKLATFLGEHEGYAIYKRFASLNARNLLYHQAKLISLEHELHEMEQTFADEKHLHYKVQHIFGSDAGTSGAILRKKYEEVSQALEKYNALLLEQRQLHELPKPDSSFVDSIYNFITSEKAEDPDWLEHPANTVYAVWDDDREPIQKDLVTLNPEFKNQDMFTHFITTKGLDWWHTIFHRFRKADDQEFDVYVYASKTLSRFMGAVTLLIASALPTSSIIALYFIRSEIWRLIFIVLFAGLFAGALGVFTEARRIDVFAASAALASVQVVFVGTAFGNGNQSNG